MSDRLMAFLQLLATRKAYGRVAFELREGRIVGPIEFNQKFLEETLPQPPQASGEKRIIEQL